MKKFIIAAAGLAMISTAAQAHDIVSNKRVCNNVETPIYGTRTVTTTGNGNAGEGALAGMIIGGILGKGVSGNDKGAAAGAVIGGIIGADKATKDKTQTERYITGYKTERVCENVKTYQSHTHQNLNVIPVGKTGPITKIYRVRVNAQSETRCHWEDAGNAEVQVCTTTTPKRYRYELIVNRNGVEYRDFTYNSQLRIGDYWKLTDKAQRN